MTSFYTKNYDLKLRKLLKSFIYQSFVLLNSHYTVLVRKDYSLSRISELPKKNLTSQFLTAKSTKKSSKLEASVFSPIRNLSKIARSS